MSPSDCLEWQPLLDFPGPTHPRVPCSWPSFIRPVPESTYHVPSTLHTSWDTVNKQSPSSHRTHRQVGAPDGARALTIECVCAVHVEAAVLQRKTQQEKGHECSSPPRNTARGAQPNNVLTPGDGRQGPPQSELAQGIHSGAERQ